MSQGRQRLNFRWTELLDEERNETGYRWLARLPLAHGFAGGLVAKLDADETLTAGRRADSGVNTLFQGGEDSGKCCHLSPI